MTLLERINASGTTVVMATHEAGIVDQMQRRVIELSAGDIVRDERGAGYGADPRRRGRGAHRRCRGRPTPPTPRRGEPVPTEVPADEDADAVVAAVAATAAKPAKAKPAKAPAKPVKAAAPKVGRKMMDEKQPLYVEPEERDEVTDAAAAITAAATAVGARRTRRRRCRVDRGVGRRRTRREAGRRGIRAPDPRGAPGTACARRTP